jgi:hypothetical protein
MGIPVGAFSLAWSVLLLVPVIFAEGWVLHSDLKISYGRALGTATPANILSTLLGGVLAIFVTIPLMAPDTAASAVVQLVLFIPLFYLSRAIESRYSRWSLNRLDPAEVRRSVHRANLVSYAMLVIFVITRFLKSWYVNGYILW